MLELQGISAGYGRLTALHDINLTVQKGEIVFVVGPNGAGKSTMLKTISGLLSPLTGTISFNGRDIGGRSPESIARSGLALVPEGRSVFKELTVDENLAMGGMGRRDKAQLTRDRDMVLETFPILRKRLKGAAGHLSGGEQQQLAISRAILQAPELIMVDEPSLGLAPLVIDQVYDSLRLLNREAGITLLVVEQSTARILELAQKVSVLRNGRVVLQGAVDEIGGEHALEEAYFGYQAA